MGLNVLKSSIYLHKEKKLTKSETGTSFSAGVWVAGTEVNVSAL
jgi:hypothetical protein